METLYGRESAMNSAIRSPAIQQQKVFDAHPSCQNLQFALNMKNGQFANVQGSDCSSKHLIGAGNLQVGNMSSANDAATAQADIFDNNSESFPNINSAKRSHNLDEINLLQIKNQQLQNQFNIINQLKTDLLR